MVIIIFFFFQLIKTKIITLPCVISCQSISFWAWSKNKKHHSWVILKVWPPLKTFLDNKQHIFYVWSSVLVWVLTNKSTTVSLDESCCSETNWTDRIKIKYLRVMFFVLLQDFDAELSQSHHVLQSLFWSCLNVHWTDTTGQTADCTVCWWRAGHMETTVTTSWLFASINQSNAVN